MTRVVHVGLGPIGLSIARAVALEGWTSVAAVDPDPGLTSRTLGDAGVEGADVPIGAVLPDGLDADLAVVATGSRAAAVAGTMRACAERGWDVVTTCEELSFPIDSSAGVAAELAVAARASGTRMIAAGVNPGFVMDLLPAILALPMATVEEVRVSRRVDVSERRSGLQQKVGVGLRPEAFEAAVSAGDAGHVGLRESLHALARGLGQEIREESFYIAPVIAERSMSRGGVTAEPGTCLGSVQRSTGTTASGISLALSLEMALGTSDPSDLIEIDGDPGIRCLIEGGLQGDRATVAMVVKSCRALSALGPGFWTLMDLCALLPSKEPQLQPVR